MRASIEPVIQPGRGCVVVYGKKNSFSFSDCGFCTVFFHLKDLIFYKKKMLSDIVQVLTDLNNQCVDILLAYTCLHSAYLHHC